MTRPICGTDIDELEKLAQSATPGPWEWGTSNSVLRLTSPDGKDGGVLYATMRNGWPDISCSPPNQMYIAAAHPYAVLDLIYRHKALLELIDWEQSELDQLTADNARLQRELDDTNQTNRNLNALLDMVLADAEKWRAHRSGA